MKNLRVELRNRKGRYKMGLVDEEHEAYKCPHCDGYLIIRKQFPYDGLGCSTSLIHSEKIPHYEGSFEELEEVVEVTKTQTRKYSY